MRGALLNSRDGVPYAEFGEQREVAVKREQHVNPVSNADGGDPGVVHYPAGNARPLNKSTQDVEEPFSFP